MRHRLSIFVLLIAAPWAWAQGPESSPTPPPMPAPTPSTGLVAPLAPPVIPLRVPPEPTPLPGIAAEKKGEDLAKKAEAVEAPVLPGLPNLPRNPDTAPAILPGIAEPGGADLEPVRGLPTIRRRSPVALKLELRGNRAFDEETLRKALAEPMGEIEGDGLTPAAADDAAFFLGVHYRRNGFAQADVRAAIRGAGTLRLTVREGLRTRMGAVRFAGNAHFSGAVLRGQLLADTLARFPEEGDAPPFVEDDLNDGLAKLRGFYQAEGWLDVAVEPLEISISEDRKAGGRRANVTVAIREGVQYRFAKIDFSGDIIFYPQAALRQEMEVFTTKPFTPFALTNLERKIVYFYRMRGYFSAKVTSEIHPEIAANGAPTGAVNVHFTVEAGDLFRFGTVTQSGLRRLRPGFLGQRFRKLRHRLYNPQTLEERYRRVVSTGLFANLQLTQIPKANHEIELHFDAEEAKSCELGFSTGYTQLEGPFVGVHLADYNLLGMGRPVVVDTEVAQRLVRSEALYTDPWFLESDTALRLRFFVLNQNLKTYAKTEGGLRPELVRKFGSHGELSAFFLTRDVFIYNRKIVPEELGLTRYHVDSLGLSATWDTRDSVLNPRRGWVVNLSGDYATPLLGSSLEFLRATGRASYYQPVGSGSLLAFGVRGGVLAPLGDGDNLPIDERFFNGGSRSVRSFTERGLGPKDRRGNPVGGESFGVANAELVTPVRDRVDLALFTDFGVVTRYLENGVGKGGWAVGAGLRYRLPIGPVRLDYGWNPWPGRGQPEGAVQFSFGFAF